MEKEIRIITWIDSHGLSNWSDELEFIHLAKSRKEITTVGYVIEDNSEYIVVVQSYGNGQVDNGIMIYRRSIIREREVIVDRLIEQSTSDIDKLESVVDDSTWEVKMPQGWEEQFRNAYNRVCPSNGIMPAKDVLYGSVDEALLLIGDLFRKERLKLIRKIELLRDRESCVCDYDPARIRGLNQAIKALQEDTA